jgi:hypothetical protein
VVMQASNPSTLENCEFKASLGLHSKILSQKKDFSPALSDSSLKPLG